MLDTSFQPARGYIKIVPCRRTLTDVLNIHSVNTVNLVQANSVIHPDEWRGYYNLPQVVPACIQHNIASHSYNFVDSAIGAQTEVSNKFILYVIILLLPFWLISALDVDWYYEIHLAPVIFHLVIKYAKWED